MLKLSATGIAGWLRPVGGGEGSSAKTHSCCKSEKVWGLFVYILQALLWADDSAQEAVHRPGYCMGHKTTEYNACVQPEPPTTAVVHCFAPR